MGRPDETLTIDDLRGGRNGADPPLTLADNQCQASPNVDWWQGTFARKRNGGSLIGMTFSAGGPFTGNISSLITHVPGVDETARELWAVDENFLMGRLAAATTWTAPTLKDAVTTATRVIGVSLGGLLHLFYDSAQNRSHVWDGSTVRRTGLATPAAPTTSAMVAGAITIAARYYGVRWVTISGSDTQVRSERSASSAVASCSAKLGITVNRPTLASEAETNWEVLASDTGVAGTWYVIGTPASGTTTFDDTNATIPTTTADVSDGINYTPPSAKYAVKVGSRLVMAGCWETSGGSTTAKNNRVWWTPPIGDTLVGDSERIPRLTGIGQAQDVGDAITGLGVLNGSVYIFAYRRFWKLVPTGATGASAFQLIDTPASIGCIEHLSIINAPDENGAPCLYWWSHVGPYRLGPNGLQYLGNDLEDLFPTQNLAAGNPPVHGVYHADKHQLWWWIATGASSQGDTKVVFDTRLGRSDADAVLGGWTTGDGRSAGARCSCLMSNTLGATMSRDLKPYIGPTYTTNVIGKCDDATVTQDFSASFQAYVKTKNYALAWPGMNFRINERHLYGLAGSGITITCTVTGDDGLVTTTSSVVLTAAASETRVNRKFESGELAACGIVSFTIGDSAAAANQWELDAFIVKWTRQEPR